MQDHVNNNPGREKQDDRMRILLFEDNPVDVKLLEAILSQTSVSPFHLKHAKLLADGLDFLKTGSFDLVLLDFMLPDSQGFNSLDAIKRAAPTIPVVLLTGIDDEDLGLQVIQHGAQDYLVKTQLAKQTIWPILRHAIERKRIEKQLLEQREQIKASEERFRGLLDHNADGMLVLKQNGTIRYANPAAEQLFAKPAHELTGAKVDFAVKIGETTEFQLANADGAEYTVEVRTVETEWEGQNACLASLRDITERRRAEERQQQLQHRIQRAQRAESLAVLAGGIAHDYNNLLMGIMGNAALALSELTPDSAAQVYIEQIQQAAKRVQELTNQMLAYSGKGRFQNKPLDVHALLERIEPLLHNVLQERVTLTYEVQASLPPIKGDSAQVSQVLVNLVTNAAEAMEGKSGIVSIRADKEEMRQPLSIDTACPQQELEPGTYIRLQVSDSGVGIKAQNIDRIFEPFFTTKFTGRGLGLASALGIVRGHGGGISVKSVAGEGTVVSIYLPTTQELPKAGTTVAATPDLATLNKRLILVIDDEELIRTVTEKALQKFGFRVLTAADGREGIEVFQKNRDEIALVLLDLTMPDMNGDAVFTRIQQLDPAASIVLSSGYAEQDATRDIPAGQLAGFLQKPYLPSQLLATIQRILKNSPQKR